MRNRRFALLAATLVALNLVLWLAPQGLALRRSVSAKLFGPKLVRADLIESTGGTTIADWRLDRGIVSAVTPTQLTLDEADGRVQTITVDPTTRVRLPSGRKLQLSSVGSGWRVLVTWPANGTATVVQVERRAHRRGPGRHLRQHS